MNKISKLFCTGLALLSQSMFLAFGASNIDEPQTKEHIEQSVISPEKDHKEESLVGNYVGWYQENRRIHGMNLDIIENNGIYNAVFKFYQYSYSSDTSSGSFSMTIEKNKDGTYNFIQNEWIDKPDEYDMVDLLNCTVSNSTISGGVFLRSDSDIEKREIGYMFATTIEEEIYGKYESWYWDGEKKHDLILTVEKLNGRPSAVLNSDALDTPLKYEVVPILAHGNYNFIAAPRPKISPRMSIVFDVRNCVVHDDILTGIITTIVLGKEIMCGSLTMKKV